MSTGSDLILIDSRNRQGTSSTSQSFTLGLQETLYGTYELVSFSMSNNLYNVVSGENDKLYLNHSTEGNKTITLTPGKYEGSTLATMLKTVMDAGMSGGITFTVSYSSTTGKITFTPSAGTFKFTFSTNTSASCRKIIGKNEVDDTTASAQTSDNPIELRLHDNIAIKVAQDSNQHITLLNGLEASIMIPIDNNVSFNSGVIQYQRNKGFNQYLTFGSTITYIDITVYSQDGDALPLNSTEWSMCIKKLY